MRRGLISCLVTLLTLLGVCHAKDDNQIRLYQWKNEHCTEMTHGGNIDIALDKCYDILDATSIKITPDHKRQQWLQGVNDGSRHCYISFFSGPKCSMAKVDTVPLPEAFSRCYTPRAESAIKAVNWYCEDVNQAVPEVTEQVTTTGTTSYWTMNDFDHMGQQTSTWTSVHDTTEMVTPTPKPTAARITVSCPSCLEPPKVRRDEISGDIAGKHVFETYIHLKHPWAETALCFHCYMKKAGDFRKMECRSGHGHKNKCSPPQYTTPFPPIKTLSVLAQESTYTWTSTVSARPQLEARGSWHKQVHFKHPFADLQICADAEWEKRGKPKTEIRLQKVKFSKHGGDCDEGMDLDLPIQATVTVTGFTRFTTTTVTVAAQAAVVTAEGADMEESVEEPVDAEITHRDL